MSSIGHLVICYEEKIWFFIPEFLTENQRLWLNDKKDFFNIYAKDIYYAIVNNEQYIIDSRDYCDEDKDRFSDLYEFVNKSLESEVGERTNGK